MRKPLYDHTRIDRAPEEVRAIIAGDPTQWLPDPGKPFAGDRWEVVLHAERLVPLMTGAVSADVHVGPVRMLADGRAVVRALTWRAIEDASTYPTFEGEVEVTALSDRSTQLSVFGSYVPPMGPLGGAFDAALGHRVAELTMRNFVTGVAERVQVVHLAT